MFDNDGQEDTALVAFNVNFPAGYDSATKTETGTFFECAEGETFTYTDLSTDRQGYVYCE